jgi:ribosome-associated heat shock protein Hsp15
MSETRQRLDKWLWFARFAKSRTLSAKLITEGYVRVNGQRVTVPAKAVGAGDVVTVAAGHGTMVVEVAATGLRRGPAPEARALYREIERDDGTLVSEGSRD